MEDAANSNIKRTDGKPDGRMVSDDDSSPMELLRNFESRLSKSISAFDKRLMNSRQVMREIDVSVKPMAETSRKRLEKRIDEFDRKITAMVKKVEKL